MPERLSFVPTYHAAAVEECLASDEHVAKLLGRAASQHLEQARLTLTPTLTLTLTLTLNLAIHQTLLPYYLAGAAARVAARDTTRASPLAAQPQSQP